MHSVAILLAAGFSERMGAPKALIRWRGRPLLAHQIRQIERSRVSECVAVLGEDAESLRPHLGNPYSPLCRTRAVLNPSPARGKCSSILTGLTSLVERPDGILVVSVDQPIDRRLLNALLEAGEREWERGEREPGRTVVVPACGGRRGHPPLFSGRLISELMGITERTEGLKAVVRRDPERILEVPWTSTEILMNLNTPLDLVPPIEASDHPLPRLRD